MKLLTQSLPSGYEYPFEAIDVKPMTFAKILEYIENVPKDPVEKYYFDSCLLKDTDPNVGSLLLIDYEYVLYMLKAITVSDNLVFNSSVKCPRCGATLRYRVTLAEIKFEKMDPDALKGFQVQFGGEYLAVRMPTITEFMEIFKKYRLYRKVTDMRIIRLISLFEMAQMYHQRVENMVVNATYGDIGVLMLLDNIFFDFIKPFKVICNDCVQLYKPTDSEILKAKQKYGIKESEDLPEQVLEELKMEGGIVEVRLDDLVSNFFRDIYDNNRVTSEKILPREVSPNP